MKIRWPPIVRVLSSLTSMLVNGGFGLVFLLSNISFTARTLAQEIDFSDELAQIREVSTSEFKIEVTAGKDRYLLRGPDLTEQNPLDDLSQNEVQSFLRNRIEFLSYAAKALQAMKWGFGFGAIVKSRFTYRAESRNEQSLKDFAMQMEPGAREDLLNAIQRVETRRQHELEIFKKITFNEKGKSIIEKLLNSFDHQLWQQAQIVSRANEFGVLAAIGVEAEGGRASTGWGGLTDIGISIGFNRDEKSLAIQIFHDIEKFKNTQMPLVFITGLVMKAGVYAANQKKDLAASGISFYPPMAPAFSTSTNRSFMAGFSTGLTWPPSPLGDLLTYANKIEQVTLLRITVSPLTKGFVRMQSGLLKQISKFKTYLVKDFLAQFFSMNLSKQCSLLFQ